MGFLVTIKILKIFHIMYYSQSFWQSLQCHLYGITISPPTFISPLSSLSHKSPASQPYTIGTTLSELHFGHFLFFHLIFLAFILFIIESNIYKIQLFNEFSKDNIYNPKSI
ncbi:hypothetical protein ES705_02197 [subsurface metagenome]